jgi:hypothetical protein
MASLIETPYYFSGDLVTYSSQPKVYRVIRMKQVNLLVEDEDGKTYNLPITSAHKAPGAKFEMKEKPVNEYAAALAAVAKELHLGDTVKFTGRDAHRFPGVYVVASFTTSDRAKYVRLNGGDNQAVTGPRTGVVKVEL